MVLLIVSLVFVSYAVFIGVRKVYAKLARIVCLLLYVPTKSQARACEIMGRNFFGIEEAIQYLKITPTQSKISTLAEVPFTEEELLEKKDTHMLVAFFPISILEIYKKYRKLFFRNSDVWFSEWYRRQTFANDRGNTAWRLICKTPIKGSIDKTWREQQMLLAKNEEVPTAQMMVYMIIGHYLVTGGEWLLGNDRIRVRCSNLDSCGDRVHIGGFNSGRLDVYGSYPDSIRSKCIGLVPALKLKNFEA